LSNAVKNRVSLVVVTHNSLPALNDCMQSLRRAVKGQDFELFTVDNHSDDHPEKLIKEIFPSAQIIHNEENIGFGAACNRGALNASGEFLLFVNPDVQVDSGVFDRLREVHQDNPKVGLSAARCRLPNGSFHPTCRNFPTTKNIFLSRGSFLAQLLGRYKPGRDTSYTLPDFNENTIVPAVAGTVMMIRTELFRKLKGFDPRFFMFMEDTDLSLRVVQAGYINLFVPSAGAVHNWGHGSRTGKIKRKWHHHVSVWRYFKKHFSNPFSYVLLPLLLALNFLFVIVLPDHHHKG